MKKVNSPCYFHLIVDFPITRPGKLHLKPAIDLWDQAIAHWLVSVWEDLQNWHLWHGLDGLEVGETRWG